jgi:hypothetical protein
MSAAARQRLFTFWFGLGYPLFAAGALVSSYMTNIYVAAMTLLVLLTHIFVSFGTTCRHCPYYGTAKCGLPGLVVPWLFAKQQPGSLSMARIRIHFIFDLCCDFYLTGASSLQPCLLPLALGWTTGAWLISLGPKRYHGLLFRLRLDSEVHDRPRISLPLVSAGGDSLATSGQ